MSFIFGMLVGTVLGLLIAGLCRAAALDDEINALYEREQQRQARNPGDSP